MDPKFVAGVICFSTWRKSLVAGPSGEPWVSSMLWIHFKKKNTKQVLIIQKLLN